MDKIKEGNKTIQSILILVNIMVIAGFLSYLLTGIKLNLFEVFFGLILILFLKFQIKSYDPKLFYIAFLSIITFQGLLLTYFYLFKPLSIKDPSFYGLILIFIFFVVYLIYSYLKKGRYSKLPWN